jgi:hypothetical protein
MKGNSRREHPEEKLMMHKKPINHAAVPKHQTKKTAPRTAAKDTKPNFPDWRKTSGDGYELCWWPEAAGRELETIELSRTEYVQLKHHLARMRGYDVTVEEASNAA